LTRDRIDEARAAHKKYRVGTMSDEAMDEEFNKLHNALLNEPEKGHTVELIRGVNLKRTLIVVGMNFFQQATGQAFLSQYGMRRLIMQIGLSWLTMCQVLSS